MSAPDSLLIALSRDLGARLQFAGLRLSTAESCTGGWLAQVVTAVAGSSQWFDRGFVPYTNEAKQEMLGVPRAVLEARGAVSEAVVAAMARGAIAHSLAGISVAISGVAGPGGGSEAKPVGTVCFGWTLGEATTTATHRLPGDREQIRRRSVQIALEGLLGKLQEF